MARLVLFLVPVRDVWHTWVLCGVCVVYCRVVGSVLVCSGWLCMVPYDTAWFSIVLQCSDLFRFVCPCLS